MVTIEFFYLAISPSYKIVTSQHLEGHTFYIK